MVRSLMMQEEELKLWTEQLKGDPRAGEVAEVHRATWGGPGRVLDSREEAGLHHGANARGQSWTREGVAGRRIRKQQSINPSN